MVVTGVLRTSGLSEEEKQKFSLTTVGYQITDYGNYQEGKITGYYLLSNTIADELLGKCIRVAGTIPEEWKNKNKSDTYNRVALTVTNIEKIDKPSALFYIETMPINREHYVKGSLCIDKRIGYLALLIVPAVILIAITGMINSQNITQNSRASELDSVNNVLSTKIPTPKPTLKTYYIHPIIDVCFDSLDGMAPSLTTVSTSIDGNPIDNRDKAWKTCYEDLNSFIISNDGEWPGLQLNPTTNMSQGFLAADKVAKTWLDNGYLRSDFIPYNMRQEKARDVIVENLKVQRLQLPRPHK